jgi:hypothetical protein
MFVSPIRYRVRPSTAEPEAQACGDPSPGAQRARRAGPAGRAAHSSVRRTGLHARGPWPCARRIGRDAVGRDGHALTVHGARSRPGRAKRGARDPRSVTLHFVMTVLSRRRAGTRPPTGARVGGRALAGSHANPNAYRIDDDVFDSTSPLATYTHVCSTCPSDPERRARTPASRLRWVSRLISRVPAAARGREGHRVDKATYRSASPYRRLYPVSIKHPSPAHSGGTWRVARFQCAACMHPRASTPQQWSSRAILGNLGQSWAILGTHLRACILGRAHALTVDARVRPAGEDAQDLVRTCLTAWARFRI